MGRPLTAIPIQTVTPTLFFPTFHTYLKPMIINWASSNTPSRVAKGNVDKYLNPRKPSLTLVDYLRNV
jgi:hypothetical protein